MLTVNGRPILYSIQEERDESEERPEMRPTASLLREHKRNLTSALDCRLVLIAFDGLSIVEVDPYDFFRCILNNASADSTERMNVLASIGDMQAVPVIEQWLASYTPPERLVQSGRNC
ncbi:MAG: hypothetical protein R3C05_04295 [Pirellulaceae bacterium]